MMWDYTKEKITGEEQGSKWAEDREAQTASYRTVEVEGAEDCCYPWSRLFSGLKEVLRSVIMQKLSSVD